MSMPVTSADMLQRPLPDINVGPNCTQSDAIHHIKYVGPLRPWATFKPEVIATFQNTNWSPVPLSTSFVNSPTLGPLETEHILCGDETGLQGRFEERVGQVLGVVFEVNQIDLVFGDFKCTTNALTYRKTPDIIIMRPNGSSYVVGEIKTFWVYEHQLARVTARFNFGEEKFLRQVLGQIAQYMQDLDLKFGFISTYNETFFLRQVPFGRTMGLEFSPVIHHNEMYTREGDVTVRQGMIHLALCSLVDPHPDTGLRGVWTVDT
ncbi:hypothetical protein N7491_002826 [Penicillium cf. griseofulvum]|uniref:Uncharacterized protein n=1 Tax=Penicillium cf. griseofulvum TaxID=2972120 RepID=A0A9W9MSF0_9EURO|nr:hypothetical protein N7472_003007 [Penicillium cf. griseofulvum]KAJ5440420.1 hypothetical protein N7491_002826 [Penicillium cf. griseofulvum]KAJ5448466.1 hypothetical protein N7445_003287 [Penicillium cf. griseofulvum]